MNQIGFRVRGRIGPLFLARHAISPEDAIDYTPEARDRRAFDRLIDKRILRPVASGRYWFDLPAYFADAEAVSRRMVPLSILGAVVIAGLAMLFYRG